MDPGAASLDSRAVAGDEARRKAAVHEAQHERSGEGAKDGGRGGSGAMSSDGGLIAQADRLAEIAERLAEAPWAGLDTEADSLHAYPEKLCLLQIAIPNRYELVDPLAGLDLAPLWNALGRHELILHGADYDLRMLRRSAGFVPRSIFDTMLAARLTGHSQFGLTHLVLRHLGIRLEKGAQKSDWGRRPLTERMRTYALNDVRHLEPLAARLRAELERQGRLEWHRECCAELVKECAQTVERDPAREWRLGGSERLSRSGLAVLRELYYWREKEARAANRPPFFILDPRWMLEIARSGGVEAVADRLPRRWPSMRHRSLAAAVERGLSVPPADQPEPLRQRHQRFTRAQQLRYHEWEQRRDRRARALGLDPSLIASRSMLVAVARDESAADRVLMRWQRDLLGIAG
ncbi:MAG TPA: HRDC domain-containing protein [Candidatus Paceibacterota bacterium]|nr:HRDC domain-containing protein [Candidatus Paceibacterota bacterium]